ncbi:hypothetical protein [Kingella potus]|uniref:hypothetical protein n=1 Tax=Kingella potus TaxID=265175 RepID=UPI001FD07528|nr:hypothetical protein [Kingella potus]UOO99876.1 hypothetical protein LVJ84_07245 [Kingella potus]
MRRARFSGTTRPRHIHGGRLKTAKPAFQTASPAAFPPCPAGIECRTFQAV